MSIVWLTILAFSKTIMIDYVSVYREIFLESECSQ